MNADTVYVRWDFHGVSRNGLAILRWPAMPEQFDAPRTGLKAGMRVLLWDKDEDHEGKPALMVVEGIVEFDSERNQWLARQDMSTLHYEYDISRAER